MPFRSEGEQVREQIRRIEEEARELLDEQVSLERQVKEATAIGRSLVGLLVATVAIAATTFIAYESGKLEAMQRAAQSIEELERNEVAPRDIGRARLSDCSRRREQASAETSACRSELADLERRLRNLSSPAPRDDAARGFR